MKSFTLKEYNSAYKSGIINNVLKFHDTYIKHTHEIEDFYKFTVSMIEHLSPGKDYSGWYLSADISIVADFDAILFGEKFILNLDLKHSLHSKTVEGLVDKFKNQSRIIRLIQKDRIVYNVCFVAEKNELYMYNSEDKKLDKITFNDIIQLITGKILDHNELLDLAQKDFLINPWEDVDKFLESNYWLTNIQQKISENLQENGVYGVKGGAGTGKTLIACDALRKIAKYKKVLFVVPSHVENKIKLINSFGNTTIMTAKQANDSDLEPFDVIIIDEAQRIFGNLRNKLFVFGNLHYKDKTLAMFFDCEQSLGPDDSGKIIESTMSTFKKDNKGELFELTENVRSNKAISYFVRNLKELKSKPPKDISINDYKNHIEVKYFSDMDGAINWIEDMINNGYKFIVPTGDRWHPASVDKLKSKTSEKENTHAIIGSEFDKVVSYIDECVKYTREGILIKNNDEHYFLDHEIYVNLSRAREKLALAVINNTDVYNAIVEVIFEYKKGKTN